MTDTFKFEGIGTHWWITIPDKIEERLFSEVQNNILNILHEFDEKYSRFKENSLISKLNREKSISDFPLELYEMLKTSEKVRELTDGHFNVCVGTQLEDLGYDANYTFSSKPKNYSPDDLKIYTLTKDLIRISKDARIDLGGIGKGWLINKFKKSLNEFKLKNYLINGGGDIYVKDSNDNEHEFALENPFDDTEMIGSIKIANEAIACSSPTRRAWKDRRTGEVYHHLIDFNSGGSVNNTSAVFTQSKSIINADLASTAIFISEPEKADSIAKNLEVEYLIVFPNKKFFRSKGYKGVLN